MKTKFFDPLSAIAFSVNEPSGGAGDQPDPNAAPQTGQASDGEAVREDDPTAGGKDGSGQPQGQQPVGSGEPPAGDDSNKVGNG